MTNRELVIEALQSQGQRVTAARLRVFAALEQHGPCDMTTLQKLVGSGVHRASLYRIISTFESAGIAQKVTIGWKYKLELSDMFSDHHHHAHCNKCQKVVKLEEDASLERAIEQLAQSSQFQLTSHSLEMQGVCQDCKTKKTPGEKPRVDGSLTLPLT